MLSRCEKAKIFHGIYTPWTATSLHTEQKMKSSIKDYFFSKCDQIRRKLRIWSHLLEKSLIENFIFFVHCQRWTYCRPYNTSRPSPAFYNIRKLNRCSKTDISKSAWINVSLSEILPTYQMNKLKETFPQISKDVAIKK